MGAVPWADGIKDLPMNDLPVYEPPVITTYASDEILARMGPALTLSGAPPG